MHANYGDWPTAWTQRDLLIYRVETQLVPVP